MRAGRPDPAAADPSAWPLPPSPAEPGCKRQRTTTLHLPRAGNPSYGGEPFPWRSLPSVTMARVCLASRTAAFLGPLGPGASSPDSCVSSPTLSRAADRPRGYSVCGREQPGDPETGRHSFSVEPASPQRDKAMLALEEDGGPPGRLMGNAGRETQSTTSMCHPRGRQVLKTPDSVLFQINEREQ